MNNKIMKNCGNCHFLGEIVMKYDGSLNYQVDSRRGEIWDSVQLIERGNLSTDISQPVQKHDQVIGNDRYLSKLGCVQKINDIENPYLILSNEKLIYRTCPDNTIIKKFNKEYNQAKTEFLENRITKLKENKSQCYWWYPQDENKNFSAVENIIVEKKDKAKFRKGLFWGFLIGVVTGVIVSLITEIVKSIVIVN